MPTHRAGRVRTIVRKGYWRKAYVTRKGTHVKKTWVPPRRIRDLGKKGKGPRVIPRLRKGRLTQFGYHVSIRGKAVSPEIRHAALRKAVAKYGKNRVIDMLNAVAVLSKRTRPRNCKAYRSDMRWVDRGMKKKMNRPYWCKVNYGRDDSTKWDMGVNCARPYYSRRVRRVRGTPFTLYYVGTSKSFSNLHSRYSILLVDDVRRVIIGKTEIIPYGKGTGNIELERFSLISYVVIDRSYRGRRLCNILVKETFKTVARKNYARGVIELVIAGGMPILKCILRVVNELNYAIVSIPPGVEGSDDLRRKMKVITAEEALAIEKRNYEPDIWQRLRFVKK